MRDMEAAEQAVPVVVAGPVGVEAQIAAGVCGTPGRPQAAEVWEAWEAASALALALADRAVEEPALEEEVALVEAGPEQALVAVEEGQVSEGVGREGVRASVAVEGRELGDPAEAEEARNPGNG
ncbi:MAG: hypothetical protein ACLPSO_00020 [Terracidiphilus sp.]